MENLIYRISQGRISDRSDAFDSDLFKTKRTKTSFANYFSSDPVQDEDLLRGLLAVVSDKHWDFCPKLAGFLSTAVTFLRGKESKKCRILSATINTFLRYRAHDLLLPTFFNRLLSAAATCVPAQRAHLENCVAATFEFLRKICLNVFNEDRQREFFKSMGACQSKIRRASQDTQSAPSPSNSRPSSAAQQSSAEIDGTAASDITGLDLNISIEPENVLIDLSTPTTETAPPSPLSTAITSLERKRDIGETSDNESENVQAKRVRVQDSSPYDAIETWVNSHVCFDHFSKRQPIALKDVRALDDFFLSDIFPFVFDRRESRTLEGALKRRVAEGRIDQDPTSGDFLRCTWRDACVKCQLCANATGEEAQCCCEELAKMHTERTSFCVLDQYEAESHLVVVDGALLSAKSEPSCASQLPLRGSDS